MLMCWCAYAGNFLKFEHDWDAPAPNELLPLKEGKDGVESLTEEDLLLASPILYGFSLSDKLWRESSPSSLRNSAYMRCVISRVQRQPCWPNRLER